MIDQRIIQYGCNVLTHATRSTLLQRLGLDYQVS